MKVSNLLTMVLCLAMPAVGGDDFLWPSIPAEQLAMKDHPLAAGAHALILNWEIFTDDASNRETVSMRIKIFSEEGRSHGDVSIPFIHGYGDIKDLSARTVQPDGKVVPFRGEVFEKTIVKTKQIRYLAKTFSFPEVQPGSILEYRYTRQSSFGLMLTHTWTPQGELPILHLDFKIKPSTGWWGFRYIGRGLPPDKDLLKNKDGTFELVMDNIPAFEAESYAPPEYEVKPVVWLFYSPNAMENADEMWKRMARETNQSSQSLLAPSKTIRDTALAAVGSSDPPETKVRKLYTRVQQIRNLDFEKEKTEEEGRRERLKKDAKTEDVLKHEYGTGLEINRLYIALVRALGIEANEVFVSQRNNYFFRKEMPAAWQLNSEVVEVKLGENTWYLDPGEKFCPFGLLAWQKTGVAGLRVDKDGGTFIITPNPTSDMTSTERSARLRWKDGDLEGEATIRYKGQDALLQRLYRWQDDSAMRLKGFEDEVKRSLPEGSTAEVKQIEGFDDTGQPVTVTLDLHIPNQGIATGKRLALPLNIFAPPIGSAFRYEKRTYPLYFSYPYQELDEITVDTPDGYSLDKLPEPHREITEFGRYVSGWQKVPNGVKFIRKFALDRFFFQTSDYPGVRKFYYAVVNDDQDGALFQIHAAQ